jgi:hypothetical protein
MLGKPRSRTLAVLFVASAVGMTGAPTAPAATPSKTIAKLRKENAKFKKQVKAQARTISQEKAARAEAARLLAEAQAQLASVRGQLAAKTTEAQDLQTALIGTNDAKKALQAEIDAAATALGSTGSLAERIAAINTILGGSGDTHARATALADSGGSAAAEVDAAKSALGGTGSLADRIAAVNTKLGASGTTLSRLDHTLFWTQGASNAASLTGRIFYAMDVLAPPNQQEPLGFLAESMRNKLGFPGSTLAGDIAAINGSLGGPADLSTADRVGNPLTGTTGLAALTRNATAATNTNGFNVADFNNATSIHDQLQEYLDVYQSSVGTNATFTVPQGGYTSLRQLLSALNHSP